MACGIDPKRSRATRNTPQLPRHVQEDAPRLCSTQLLLSAEDIPPQRIKVQRGPKHTRVHVQQPHGQVQVYKTKNRMARRMDNKKPCSFPGAVTDGNTPPQQRDNGTVLQARGAHKYRDWHAIHWPRGFLLPRTRSIGHRSCYGMRHRCESIRSMPPPYERSSYTRTCQPCPKECLRTAPSCSPSP